MKIISKMLVSTCSMICLLSDSVFALRDPDGIMEHCSHTKYPTPTEARASRQARDKDLVRPPYHAIQAQLTSPEVTTLTGFTGNIGEINRIIAQYAYEIPDKEVILRQLQQARTIRFVLFADDDQTKAFLENTVAGDAHMEGIPLLQRKAIVLTDVLYNESFWRFAAGILDTLDSHDLAHERQVVFLRTLLRYAALSLGDLTDRLNYRMARDLVSQLMALPSKSPAAANPVLSDFKAGIVKQAKRDESSSSPSPQALTTAAVSLQASLGDTAITPIADHVRRRPDFQQLRAQSTQAFLSSMEAGKKKQEQALVYRLKTYSRNIRGFANDSKLHLALRDLVPLYSLPQQYLDNTLTALNLFFNFTSRFHMPKSVIQAMFDAENGTVQKLTSKADCSCLNAFQVSIDTTIPRIRPQQWDVLAPLWDKWVVIQTDNALIKPYTQMVANLPERWKDQVANLRRAITIPSSLAAPVIVIAPSPAAAALGPTPAPLMPIVRVELPSFAERKSFMPTHRDAYSSSNSSSSSSPSAAPSAQLVLFKVADQRIPKALFLSLTLRTTLDKHSVAFLQRMTINYEMLHKKMKKGEKLQSLATPFYMDDLVHYPTQMRVAIESSGEGICFALPNYARNPMASTYTFLHPMKPYTKPLCPGRIGSLITAHTDRGITLDSPWVE